ncbi:DNA polymerase beta domain protein region [Pyrolobus fumarii 1A]|uniref:DNA polymerase beta domain protein region n=1 Tax=Pyrolobus fumarii (strain DSM 11204 / 1A) TaxID=694429 RepID=G0ECW5_PYRF1|nr:DNA polymerase beta domain containing protein [Pyrolobus fumarii]AEM39685.1 DNA polymerase beta domain protein region [Pyrolobus fumarii 1A]
MTSTRNESVDRAKMLQEWRAWVERIARAAARILPDVEVYAFRGKAGRETSAINVLIVSNNVPGCFLERASLKARIEEAAGLPYNHPFRIHLMGRREAEFYKHNIQGIDKIL